ncbi:MAG: hydroxymethylbilane synthase [Roseburia sp.]
MEYKIGTRGSKLALIQAEYVCNRLREQYPQDQFSIEIIQTQGDICKDKPLDQIGTVGVFAREIEQALLAGQIQIGVHSMKDMPAVPAEGLMFSRAWQREDPRDVLILRTASSLGELPQGAVIGTGSKRRSIQLRALRPDLRIVTIRGNVDTRLRKMEEQKLDGLVLAAAGIHRLGLTERITQYLEPEEMIPAPAQGALAIEIRKDDVALQQKLDALSDEKTQQILLAERGFLQEIGADCHVPVGAICRMDEKEEMHLRVMYGDADGKRIAYDSVSGRDPVQLAKEAAAHVRAQLAGHVSLVGAGPGDPGLITAKGLEEIRRADCILYDRLVPEELLQQAPTQCEKIYVGKENHHHAMKQEEMNALLIAKSMEHGRVVRLKGGDPFVFGRGGEEAMALAEAGVPFAVIPGVSSCIAAAETAGIPITHRGIADGFHVVTAHNRKDELADIDFEAMARGNDTCVFLMGLSKLPEIVAGLTKAGMAADMPVAVIAKGTTSKQQCVCGTLDTIVELCESEKPSAPAIILVGKVVSLREKLREGYRGESRYLVTQVDGEKNHLAELLEQKGAIVDVVQTGEIRYDEYAVSPEQLREADWLIFTSRHGVEGFFRCLMALQMDVRSLAGCKLAVVGRQTAQHLAEHGLQPALTACPQNGEALWKSLSQQAATGDNLLYCKAANASEQFPGQLMERCQIHVANVYENLPVANMKANFSLEKKICGIQGYSGIFFTCASGVQRFAEALDEEEREQWRRKICCYSIGPKTTEILQQQGVENIVEAAEASYEALAELI